MTEQDPVQKLQVKTEQTSPNDSAIAALAYSLWQGRGCPEGSAEDDWLKAERMLTVNNRQE